MCQLLFSFCLIVKGSVVHDRNYIYTAKHLSRNESNMFFMYSLLQYHVFVFNCYVLTSRPQLTIKYSLTTVLFVEALRQPHENLVMLLKDILMRWILSRLYFRHHTNPVGTEWKWKMDDPDTIVNGAMENHRNMIKQFRGKLHDWVKQK